MTRIELINSLIKRYNYQSYLEIGVNTPDQPGWSHDSIVIPLIHGVDPALEAKATFPVTSDEFFSKHIHQKYDLVFIDGLHIYEQAYRDIVNSLQWLNENGTIVVHDCNPVKEITQRRERASDVWHGDVWKAILKLRLENSNVDINTVNTDEGCAIIRKGRQTLLNIPDGPTDPYTFNFFNSHRKDILHLISVEEFKKMLYSLVIIKITGGMGNQLFQYALGKNLEVSNGLLVKYDISWYNQQAERKLEIKNFRVNIPEATDREIKILEKNLPRTGKLGWLFNIFSAHSFAYIQEQKLTFNPSILRVKPPVYLDGCWQSEKYFQSIADRLRAEFQVRAEPTGENAKMLVEMKKQEAVAVHFRRGDYVKMASTNQTHGTPTLGYYHQAADYIMKNVEYPIFYIYSDDINWVRENFKLAARMVFVDQNGTDKGYEDLRLMQACRHHIIANSTFSWWGAWLAEHPGQIVIAPKQWFQSPTMDASDVVPERWLRL